MSAGGLVPKRAMATDSVPSVVRHWPDRAVSMKEKGHAFFSDWEQQTKEIQKEGIRKEAEKRLAKRRKSYGKILSSMEEAKEQFVPFMSDLNDVRKLLESELSASTVASTKSLIRQANWHGEDVRESLTASEQPGGSA